VPGSHPLVHGATGATNEPTRTGAPLPATPADTSDTDRKPPIVFVAAPDWHGPESTWPALVRTYAETFKAHAPVHLALLIDSSRGFQTSPVLTSLRGVLAAAGLDPDRAAPVTLIDDYQWDGEFPDVFREAHVFVVTELETAELRRAFLASAESKAMPKIRKADLGEAYRRAAHAAGLLIASDGSAESLEAARLLLAERAVRQPIGTY